MSLSAVDKLTEKLGVYPLFKEPDFTAKKLVECRVDALKILRDAKIAFKRKYMGRILTDFEKKIIKSELVLMLLLKQHPKLKDYFHNNILIPDELKSENSSKYTHEEKQNAASKEIAKAWFNVYLRPQLNTFVAHKRDLENKAKSLIDPSAIPLYCTYNQAYQEWLLQKPFPQKKLSFTLLLFLHWQKNIQQSKASL